MRDTSRLATTAIVFTGGYTALYAYDTIVLRMEVDGTNAGPTLVMALVSLAVVVAGWVSLSRWQSAVADNITEARYPAPSKWRFWLGWLIPVAALSLPIDAMRQLDYANKVKARWYWVWWGLLIGTIVAAGAAGMFSLAVTETGEPTAPIPGWVGVGLALMFAGSWWGLVTVIRTIDGSYAASLAAARLRKPRDLS